MATNNESLEANGRRKKNRLNANAKQIETKQARNKTSSSCGNGEGNEAGKQREKKKGKKKRKKKEVRDNEETPWQPALTILRDSIAME
jgi:hypothetical protein